MAPLKFAYVLAPVLPIQVETQRRGGELPLLVTSPVDSSAIFACSPEAAAAGVTPGISVYQARQMVPQALLIAPDELAYHASHGALQAALQAYSPLIETVALGEFLVDVRAVAASHGGDQALAAALASAAASASGLSVQVGVGGGRFVAEQAARQAHRVGFFVPGASPAEGTPPLCPGFGHGGSPVLSRGAGGGGQARPIQKPPPVSRGEGGSHRGRFSATSGRRPEGTPPLWLFSTGEGSGVGASRDTEDGGQSWGLVVPPGDEAAFLAPLPVEVLPNLPGEVRRRLYLFDLYTLGDLAALRKPAVLRQFGGQMAGLYELARGRDPRPLNPDVPPLRLVRSLRLPSPASARQPLLNAVQRLCWQVSKVLAHKGYHAEALKLTLYSAHGGSVELGLAAKPPTSDETRLSRLAAQLLGRLPITSPVAAVAVSVYPLRAWHLGAHQIDLLRAGVPEKQLRFENALQLLVHRFGQAVLRVAALLGPPVPLPVKVRLDAGGLPLSVEVGGLDQQVLSVTERWREEKHWWDVGRAQRRDYYRVALADDSFRNIFQDLLTEAWYLDRAWPVL
jgi:nucleotidyltransferase/DNA polymerase involved in DNA repair